MRLARRRSSQRRVAMPMILLLSLLPGGSASAAVCWLPPVSGRVADPFREPACRWCAGNRGIEYRVAPGTVVRAVGAGTVTYAGSVAGTVYVVVRHADGRRITYGRLTDRFVRRGDRVVARARIGTASGSFHFGVRLGNRYVDPEPLLGALVGRPRLVPLDGTRARPAGPPRVRCKGGTTESRR